VNPSYGKLGLVGQASTSCLPLAYKFFSMHTFGIGLCNAWNALKFTVAYTI